MNQFKSIARAIRRGRVKVEFDTATQKNFYKRRTSNGNWIVM